MHFVDWWQSEYSSVMADKMVILLYLTRSVPGEEVDQTVRVPVAMGWVVPVDGVPQPVRRESRPARAEAVYVVPGARSALALDSLRHGLQALASANGLSLPDTVLP